MVTQPSWMAHNVYKKGGAQVRFMAKCGCPVTKPCVHFSAQRKKHCLQVSSRASVYLVLILASNKLPRDVTDFGARFIVVCSNY